MFCDETSFKDVTYTLLVISIKTSSLLHPYLIKHAHTSILIFTRKKQNKKTKAHTSVFVSFHATHRLSRAFSVYLSPPYYLITQLYFSGIRGFVSVNITHAFLTVGP